MLPEDWSIRTTGKQVSLKRKARFRERRPSMNRKRTLESASKVDAPVFRDSECTRNVWRTDRGHGYEPFAYPITWRSDQRRQTYDDDLSDDTFRGLDYQSRRQRRPDPEYEKSWSYDDFPEQWPETDWNHMTFRRHEDPTNQSGKEGLAFERLGPFNAPSDRGANLDRHSVTHRRHDDERSHHFGHNSGTYSGYGEWPPQSFGYHYTLASYPGFESYPRYPYDPNPMFERSAPRRAGLRLKRERRRRRWKRVASRTPCRKLHGRRNSIGQMS